MSLSTLQLSFPSGLILTAQDQGKIVNENDILELPYIEWDSQPGVNFYTFLAFARPLNRQEFFLVSYGKNIDKQGGGQLILPYQLPTIYGREPFVLFFEIYNQPRKTTKILDFKREIFDPQSAIKNANLQLISSLLIEVVNRQNISTEELGYNQIVYDQRIDYIYPPVQQQEYIEGEQSQEYQEEQEQYQQQEQQYQPIQQQQQQKPKRKNTKTKGVTKKQQQRQEELLQNDVTLTPEQQAKYIYFNENANISNLQKKYISCVLQTSSNNVLGKYKRKVNPYAICRNSLRKQGTPGLYVLRYVDFEKLNDDLLLGAANLQGIDTNLSRDEIIDELYRKREEGQEDQQAQ